MFKAKKTGGTSLVIQEESGSIYRKCQEEEGEDGTKWTDSGSGTGLRDKMGSRTRSEAEGTKDKTMEVELEREERTGRRRRMHGLRTLAAQASERMGAASCIDVLLANFVACTRPEGTGSPGKGQAQSAYSLLPVQAPSSLMRKGFGPWD